MNTPPALEQLPAGGFYDLYVRHAQSENNAKSEGNDPLLDRIGGYQPSIPLSELGEQQADQFAGLAGTGLARILGRDDFRIVAFQCAPAVRTRETGRRIHQGMGLDVPITYANGLRELCKGNKWLGGYEKLLRHPIEKQVLEEDAEKGETRSRYQQRREAEGWDFRFGRPWANRLGLWLLHGGETPREVGARVAACIDPLPPMTEDDLKCGAPIVRITVAHGLGGKYGVGTLLRRDPKDHSQLGISVFEAERRYALGNAGAILLGRVGIEETGVRIFREAGRIGLAK